MKLKNKLLKGTRTRNLAPVVTFEVWEGRRLIGRYADTDSALVSIRQRPRSVRRLSLITRKIETI